MKPQWRFRRTTVITIGLIGFLAGLGLARTDTFLSLAWAGVFGLLFFISLRKLNLVTVLAVLLLGISFGVVRGQSFLTWLQPYQDLYKQELVLEVKAESDGVYDDNSQLSFDGSNVRITYPYEIQLPGRIKIAGFGEQAVYRGDIVKVEGKLFPSIGSRQGSISYGELKVLTRSSSIIESIRHRFVTSMESVLPEPHASFGLGLLIGQRSTLPDDVTKQLSIVGLTHIIAVSGYNLTIIVRFVRRLLGNRSKYQITILSLALIGIFLLVTGFSASIVRASIVSTLSLAAWYYGRKFKPVLLIALAATITAGINPIYIWSDIGWYLSFLAFFGVLVLAPLLVKRIYKPGKKPRALTYIAIESICAQIMTAPLILYIFNQTSAVGLISNSLIVPLVPLAMLLVLIAGLSGVFLPSIAGLLAWPAVVLLTYILDMVSLLSRVRGALVERSLSLIGTVVLYVALVFVCVVLWQKTKARQSPLLDEII